MTANDVPITHQPVLFHRISIGRSAFGLLGGPVAWFAQLCSGYGLSSWPCFPKDQHRLIPLNGYEWSWTAMVVISLLAFVIALAACIVSWRIFQHERDPSSDPTVAVKLRAGRIRFLALWGTLAGGGFAVAVAFTAVALTVLPRCAG